MTALALRGLPRMYRANHHRFAQTVRRSTSGGAISVEGANSRYGSIVVLGAAKLDLFSQRRIFAGSTAAFVAEAIAERVERSSDLGVVALAAWASAEVAHVARTTLLDRLADAIDGAEPLSTVELAWALTALTAAARFADFSSAAERAAYRLLAAQGPHGLFPHAVPATSLGRWRAHVGCFADQVYPIQALARYHLLSGMDRSIAAANRCADRIAELQGPAGQWWWHYDVRTGGIVERYPVYSVHQHAMAPMALSELREAGGSDHTAAITKGAAWLLRHPETTAPLIDAENGVIWRKVGRREPRKVVRSLRAVATSVHADLRLRALDRLFPVGPVDYECRPYELGWFVYAWHGAPLARAQPKPAPVYDRQSGTGGP